METRANYLAIGLFTILVFAMSFGFIYWLERYGDVGEARQLQLIVPAKSGGLKVGSGVLFNGLRVGSVTSVTYRADDPAHVYASLNIRSDVPLREDTAVGVEVQPLTGLSNVTLLGGSADKPALLDMAEMPVLRAESSSLQDTIDAAGQTVKTANRVLAQVEELLTENTNSISTTVQNVEKFSSALANNADGIDQLLKNVAETSTALSALGSTIAGVSDDVEILIKAIDPEKVKTTLANVEEISTNFARGSREVDEIVDDAKATVKNLADLSAGLKSTSDILNAGSLQATLTNVEGLTNNLGDTLKKVDRVVDAIEPDAVSKTLGNLQGFTERLDKAGGEIDSIIADAKSATSNVAEFTKGLSGNKESIDKVIADATVISERLIETSAAITKLVGRVDGLVDADGKGFIAEATEAVASINKIAKSFETRADDIAAGLERFSTRGLGDIETLINESRQAVSRIEGIVRKVENNPAQFLLSGDRVPEYRPRR